MEDATLRQIIIDELEFQPSIDAAHIGVSVDAGIVTLSGHVGSYAEKIAAEEAVRRVRGVRAVAQEIEVRYPGSKKVKDDQIAKRAADILEWDVSVPNERIRIQVEHGWITMLGDVDWHFQKKAAEAAVRKLTGVTGVSNLIDVKEPAKAGDVKHHIEAALKRHAQLEANGIQVSVANGKVTLDGQVKAWHERRLAEGAAWGARGVTAVEDRIRVTGG